MNPTESTFLSAILDCPGDNSVRLVYADWLEERGDPRADFIRLEVGLATRSSAESRRGAELKRLNGLRQSIDPAWFTLLDRPTAGWRIRRTAPGQKTYGFAMPAFIHNGTYFLVSLDVYADGAFDCWGIKDLDFFRRSVARGWVVMRARVGDHVSVYSLGGGILAEADWGRESEDVEQMALEKLDELNPGREGLIDFEGSDIEIREGGRRYGKMGLPNTMPYRFSLSGEEVLGEKLPVLIKRADDYELALWFLYRDGLSQLGYATPLISIQEVECMFEDGRLTTQPPPDAWIRIPGLGRLKLRDSIWHVAPEERIREARDLLQQLNGKPGTIQRCREAHLAYEDNPADEQREALRQAYHAVPAHLRMYCGDMDSKDWPIRRILNE
jgi:uncharacterized protein (TIGR02996 family)